MMVAAGFAAGLNCSLCEAGTYGTGSGQDRLMDIDLLDPSAHDRDKDRQCQAIDVGLISAYSYCLGARLGMYSRHPRHLRDDGDDGG